MRAGARVYSAAATNDCTFVILNRTAHALKGAEVLPERATQTGAAHLQPGDGRAAVGATCLQGHRFLEALQVQPARRNSRREQLARGQLRGVEPLREAAWNGEVQMRIDEAREQRLPGTVDHARSLLTAE